MPTSIHNYSSLLLWASISCCYLLMLISSLGSVLEVDGAPAPAPAPQVIGYGGLKFDMDLNRRMVNAINRGDMEEFNRLKAQMDEQQRKNNEVVANSQRRAAENERIQRENQRRMYEERSASYARSAAESSRRQRERREEGQTVVTVLSVLGVISLIVCVGCGIASANSSSDTNPARTQVGELSNAEATPLTQQQRTGGFIALSPDESEMIRRGLPTHTEPQVPVPAPAPGLNSPRRSPLVRPAPERPLAERPTNIDDPSASAPPPPYEQAVEESLPPEYEVQPETNPDDSRNNRRIPGPV